MKHIQILSTGVGLPERLVKSSEIDARQGFATGQTKQISGVEERYYASKESATDLAIMAIDDAFSRCSIAPNDIDCVISASGTMEQAIPYNAAKILDRLNLSKPVPSFDVNMTCLSALMALNTASNMIELNEYENILIVSSEVASVGVDWSDREVGGLFGDGAAALVVSKSSDKGVIASHFETHTEGLLYCQIRGGGSLNHPGKVTGDYTKYGMFEMQGKDAYKLTSRVIENFVQNLMEKASMTLDDIDWVVPHQASKLAMEHLAKRLSIAPEKMANILERRGNQIAASIPSALHELYINKQIKPGHKILLIGTSAGLSLGGLILEV